MPCSYDPLSEVAAVKCAIGVCGIGLGHTSRQLEIARRLVERQHDVRILTFGRGYDRFLGTEFADRCLRIFVPWLDCDSRGIRWLNTVRLNWRDGLPGLVQNHRTFAELRATGFTPDVCVADYDPVTAWLARTTDTPLVTIDQSSKYLGYQIPPLNGMTREEERSRLAAFFPSATKRLATSFYKIDVPRDESYDVEIVPPIIRREVADFVPDGSREVDDCFVLVYLSSYPKKNSFVDLAQLVSIFGQFPRWRFRIYSADATVGTDPLPNVQVRPVAEAEFTEDLRRTSALICTAGHTLLSEAMTLAVPVLTIPLITYDQHLCSQVIEQAGVGTGLPSHAELSVGTVGDFLLRLAEFRDAILVSDRLLRSPTDQVLDQVCADIVAAA